MGRVYEARNDIVNTLFCYNKAQKLFKRESKKSKIVQLFIKKHTEFYEK